jgi:hypothetical protein
MFRPLSRGCATGALLILSGLAPQSPAFAASESVPRVAPSALLQPPQLVPALGGLGAATVNASNPVKNLRLDPLANSAADPLSNGVALQPDSPGAAPVSTALLTGPLSSGGGLGSLPLVSGVSQSLPG